MRILLVEDDPKMSHWLASKFQSVNHATTVVDTGERALDALGSEAFNVVVLDRTLPDIDGMEVLRRLQGTSHPPILILSTLDQASERVAGLRAGAEDYVGKPFDFQELLVRMELLVRRANEAQSHSVTLRIHDLEIDVAKRKVTRRGEPIDLTDKEFQLLRTLASYNGQTVPRGMLLEKVWGLQFDPQTNLIDVHISKLRSKIDKGFEPPLLKTVRSMGYVLG